MELLLMLWLLLLMAAWHAAETAVAAQREIFYLREPGGRPCLFAGVGAAGMGATKGLFAEPSALAF